MPTPDVDSPSWQFGAQARPWIQTLGADAFREALPDVMRQIAEVGFSGFETALPLLPLRDPQLFSDWRGQADGLQLAAAHTGGKWWDPAKAEELTDLLEDVSGLPALGCHHLMVSIGFEAEHLRSTEIQRMCETLDKLGEGAAHHGVTVAIHNHAHELRNDARILRALFEHTDATHVSLGADIGWVAYSGWDPVLFLETFGERLTYLHIRDIIQEDAQPGFIEVGRGDFDWAPIITALQSLEYQGWLTAESELSDAWHGYSDPGQTVSEQFRGISRVFQLTS